MPRAHCISTLLACLPLLACGDTGGSMADASIDATGFALPEHFELHGHRGAQGLSPENTLPAFEKALDVRVTTLEFDTHPTADGQVVIWHDRRIDASKCRVDPSADAPLPPDPDALPGGDDALSLANLTLDQLHKYRCDRNPEPVRLPDQDDGPTPLAGDDFRVITLDELLDFVEQYATSDMKTPEQRAHALEVRFNIENKRSADLPGDPFDGQNPGQFEEALVEVIIRRQIRQRTTLQCFNHELLWAMGSLLPDVGLVALEQVPSDPFALAANGATVWTPLYLTLREQHIVDAHQAGLRIIPYVVNTEAEMEFYVRLGVDGLITDRPDIGMALLERLSP